MWTGEYSQRWRRTECVVTAKFNAFDTVSNVEQVILVMLVMLVMLVDATSLPLTLLPLLPLPDLLTVFQISSPKGSNFFSFLAALQILNTDMRDFLVVSVLDNLLLPILGTDVK